MPELVIFTPDPEGSPEDNLGAFVSMCRNRLTAFGADLPFDEDVWDVTDHLDRRGHGKKRSRLRFSQGLQRGSEEIWLALPFRDFAKAFLRYSHAYAPVQNIAPRLSSLRVIEDALRGLNRPLCITSLDRHVLNKAAGLAADRFGRGVAYQVGKKLEQLAKLTFDLRLVSSPVRGWKSHIRKPCEILNRVGSEFNERRAQLLPSSDALEALARAYRFADSPLDITVTSIAALMCCAPDRINEILSLPVDCEFERDRPDGSREFGLRWPGSKGKSAHIKWILPTFEAVARDALARIKAVTAEARKIAAWYDANPTSLYLPDELAHLRQSETMTAKDFAAVTAFSERGKAGWYGPKGITPASIKPWRIKFSDVERAISQSLPQGFPIADKRTGLRFKDALCVFNLNFARADRMTSRCAIQVLTINKINEQLGSGLGSGKTSIFERMGITLADGSPVKLTTKLFRHYLNTIGQGAGLSQFEIAKWSGRADVGQNIAYDHVGADELLEQSVELLGLDWRDSISARPREPVSIHDLKQWGFLTAHATECGYCVHDFTMLPCQFQLDCSNCEEHVCVKGDVERTERIRRILTTSQELLKETEKALADGRRGADRWLEHHRTTVARLSALLQILDDPSVPVGTLIRLNQDSGATLIGAAAARAIGPLDDLRPPMPKPLLLGEVKRISNQFKKP